MPPARKPAKSRSKKARARRSPVPWPPRLPVLEQRHLDLIGLGLVAVGVFLAFPLYAGWEGGEAGPGDRRRPHLGDRPRRVGHAGGARGRRRPARHAPRAARGRAALPRGRAVPARRRLPGARGGHARASGRATARRSPSAAGTSARSWPTAQHAPVLRRRRPHPGHLPVLRRAAAAHRRDGRRRAARHRRAGGRDGAHAAPAAAPAHEPERDPDADAAPAAARPRGRGGRHPSRRRAPASSTARCAIPTSSRPPSPRRRRPEAETPEPPADPRARARGGARAARSARRPTRTRTPRLEHLDPGDVEFRLPDARILKRSSAEQVKPDTAGQEKTTARLVEALGHLGVQAQVIGAVAGPHITRYELQLAPGVKMAKVANLKNDLAYALAATEIRILAPIPGKRAVGVEVPNRHRRVVTLGDVFSEPPATSRRSRCGWARTSRARRSPPTWPRCPTCWWPAPPARASRAPSTRCSPRSCCARRPTRCASCSSTPSRSSSTTTRRSRTCSRRSSPRRGWPPTRCRTSCARWSGATA